MTELRRRVSSHCCRCGLILNYGTERRMDEELENAFVQYSLATGAECSDEFVRVVTVEVLRRGAVICDRCGEMLRAHVLMALRAGGKHLNHKFAAVGK